MPHQKLFTSFTFHRSQKQMHNRIALAPMTNMQSHDDGTLSDAEYEWLIRRAKEDFGILLPVLQTYQKMGKVGRVS